MIAFRKNHPVIRMDLEHSGTGYPSISIHNGAPDYSQTTEQTRTLGVLYAGYNRKERKEDIVYICINAYWEPETIRLPYLPKHFAWYLGVNTGIAHDQEPFFDETTAPEITGEFIMKERSVAVFTGRSRR